MNSLKLLKMGSVVENVMWKCLVWFIAIFWIYVWEDFIIVLGIK